MRNKIIATTILIASIILVGKSLTPLKIYSHIKEGNSLVESEKYSEGRGEYEKSLSLKDEREVHSNILKSFYKEKNYEEVIKSSADENFLKGNSLVYLGDNSPEKSQEYYKKALEEYKLAMKKSDDINIKKNYELTLKKLQESSQKNQDNQQDNQENQDNQKDKQNQQQNNQQNSDNQEQNNSNSQENNQQNKDNQSSNNEQNQDKQSSDNQQQNSNQGDNQDKENNQPSGDDKQNGKEQENKDSQTQNSAGNSNQGEEQSQEEIREQEVRAILQRLEGSEKQSFKNNERVMDINNNNPSNRW